MKNVGFAALSVAYFEYLSLESISQQTTAKIMRTHHGPEGDKTN
jgi:hypothetical protein